MKRILTLLLLICLFACKDKKNTPDVSNIKVDLSIVRFEQDFFAIDTNNIDESLQKIFTKYPGFTRDYLGNILGIDPDPNKAMIDVRLFLRTYKSFYDSSQAVFTNTNTIKKETEEGLRYAKYYFPKYKTPEKLFTFIGPFDAMFSTATGLSGDIITPDGLAVGLQFHLGKDFSFYKSELFQEKYPAFVQRKFTPQYIATNCLKNVVDDILPPVTGNKTLSELMTDAGKRMYMLDMFLPNTPDSIKTGYTQQQLDACYKNEKYIWKFFVENNLLFVTDSKVYEEYMKDGPKTQSISEDAPGYIGQFVGWQIVKKWMAKDEKRTLQDLVKTPAKVIFEEAKYKP